MSVTQRYIRRQPHREHTDVTIATLRLRVLKNRTAWVRFSFSDWRETDLMYQGESVLGSVTAAEVHAQAAATRAIFLPVIVMSTQ